ncbi:MAG: PDR/VanB family oxidoreductase [Nocardioides sp.]|uniref:PDR/VanB family oxidoreductase n=1 Tax=Nocardioides sp. TaxID=35761 RepID=UPI0039E257C1
MTSLPTGGGNSLRVGPAAPNRTMRTLDFLVERAFLPLAENTWKSRHPVGQVNRDLDVRITAVEELGPDVRSLTFAAVDGKPLPAWFPGAHIDLVLPSGRLRQYSLNGPRSDKQHWRIAVRRIPREAGGGGGSIEVHGLEVGDEVVVRGPREAFPFVFNPNGYLFVAGGIGITPILPMLRRTARRGRVPWQFVYTGRSRETMPFLDEISEIAGATRGAAERIHVWPDDERGTPDVREIIGLAPLGASLYTCGPVAMIDAIRRVIPDPQIDSLHYERFSPPPVVAGRPFTIRFASDNTVLRVGANETALTAVRRARPDQAYSCQQGFCGTCKVRVLEGSVQHRDRKLADYERESHMLLCVSRAAGELVIDA